MRWKLSTSGAYKRVPSQDAAMTHPDLETGPLLYSGAVAAISSPSKRALWDKKRRIEDFKPVALPKSDYGKFYSGDSSIVLQMTSPKGGAYLYDVHFWIGKDSSQDEAGTVAIKTVELDSVLGGRAV
ncbi:hypothetical protein ZWY2020_000450 [Hordeum vulgare]|nr:hypothetical protein ZWY2020_000450 [Hordeum vulgare]